eukprot:m.60255 g.60255  ORF g.60255 m.60255 type:complete len:607 (-) comp11306_c0_seq1:79-1899(-)
MSMSTFHKKYDKSAWLDRPVTLEIQTYIQYLHCINLEEQTFNSSFVIVATLPNIGLYEEDSPILGNKAIQKDHVNLFSDEDQVQEWAKSTLHMKEEDTKRLYNLGVRGENLVKWAKTLKYPQIEQMLIREPYNLTLHGSSKLAEAIKKMEGNFQGKKKKVGTGAFLRNGRQVLETDENGELVCNWHPHLQIENLIELKGEWKMTVSKSTNSEGKMDARFKYRISGVLGEEFQIKDFPFDVQRLSIRIISTIPYVTYEKDQVHGVLRLMPSIPEVAVATMHGRSIINVDAFMLSSEYHIKTTKVLAYPTTTSVLVGTPRPKIKMSVVLARRPRFWVYSVVLPIFLISIFGSSCLFIDPDVLEARLSVAVAFILTGVLFRHQASERMPKASNMTWLNLYMLACEIYLYVVLAIVIISDAFKVENGKDRFKWWYLGLAVNIIFLLGNIAAYIDYKIRIKPIYEEHPSSYRDRVKNERKHRNQQYYDEYAQWLDFGILKQRYPHIYNSTSGVAPRKAVSRRAKSVKIDDDKLTHAIQGHAPSALGLPNKQYFKQWPYSMEDYVDEDGACVSGGATLQDRPMEEILDVKYLNENEENILLAQDSDAANASF